MASFGVLRERENALPFCFILPVCDRSGHINPAEMFGVGQEIYIRMLDAYVSNYL